MDTSRPYGGVPADERSAARRERLIDAGLDVLASGVPADVTVRGVCRTANLTSRYFYEHFKDRDELLAAVFAREAQAVIAGILDAALAAGDDPRARGLAAISALLDALESDGRRADLGRASVSDEFLSRQREAIAAQMSALLAENAEVLWPDVGDDPARIAIASRATVAAVLEAVIAWLGSGSAVSRDELGGRCTDAALAIGGAFLTPRDGAPQRE